MADGNFPTLVSKDTTANVVSNPIWVQLTDGATAISVTSNALDVNVDNTVTVSASNLDIRDLVKGIGTGEDNILIFANTAKDGSGTDYVPLVDTDGKLIISNPGGTTYTEDVAAPQPSSGPTILVQRDDVLSAITPIDGDWSKLYCDANGALWVDEVNSAAIKTAVEIMDDWDDSNYCNVNLNLAGTDVTGGAGAVAAGTPRMTLASDDPAVVALQIMDDWDNGADQANIDIAACSTYVTVSKDSNANSITNPIYVQSVTTGTTTTEIHDYATTADTGNNDYTVTGTTFLLKSVIFGASGAMKAEIQTGPVGTLVTKAVGFIPKAGGTEQLFFDPPIEVPATSTGTVRVIMTNREGSAMSVYSTIIGNDIP